MKFQHSLLAVLMLSSISCGKKHNNTPSVEPAIGADLLNGPWYHCLTDANNPGYTNAIVLTFTASPSQTVELSANLHKGDKCEGTTVDTVIKTAKYKAGKIGDVTTLDLQDLNVDSTTEKTTYTYVTYKVTGNQFVLAASCGLDELSDPNNKACYNKKVTGDSASNRAVDLENGLVFTKVVSTNVN